MFTLPDAAIWTPLDRARCARHWRDKTAELEPYRDDLGEKDYGQYRLMKQFSFHVGDILATVADTLQPKSFEEFERHGFADIPAGSEMSR